MTIPQDDEIREVIDGAVKSRSPGYKRAAQMLEYLDAENRLLREQVIAALRLREIGLAEAD